jgi:DNA-binding GntR family transcriptional regulator
MLETGYPPALSVSFNRTLSEQVAAQLRQAILNGELKPGRHIVERDIAEAMRLSRGPVRDALKLLENEGLVVRYAHQGTFVAWLTLHDAEEIYSLRTALETLALNHAIRYATEDQIGELDRIVDQMVARLSVEFTQEEATELDLQFHEMLCTISNHSRLLAAWNAVRAQIRLLILTHRILQPTDFRDHGIDFHRRLVSCLRQRDVNVGHEVLDEHLASSYRSVVEAIRHNHIQPLGSSDNTGEEREVSGG